MQQGYIEPGVECYVPVGAWEGGGGYSFADRGPTSVEVRQAALDLYLEAQAHAGKDGPWNRAVRVYHAPRGDVQNMLVIERSASATLVKRDAASGEALAGAEFDVVAREDVIAPDGVVQASAGQVMAHVSTGADGTARVSGLPLGSGSATYAFIETKAPAGHVLDATPREFTVSTNGQQASVVTATVEAENEKNSLVVAKGELGREDVTLPGTEFVWWSAAEGDDPSSAPSARSLVVGEDGTLRIEGIAPGEWHLRESRPLPGYLLDATLWTVRVDEAGLVSGDWLEGGAHATATLANDYTKVDVSKRSVTGEEEVPGATLTIRDEAGEVVETWVSGTEPHRVERLEPGTYTLTEELTPRAYDQAETVTFTVEGDRRGPDRRHAGRAHRGERANRQAAGDSRPHGSPHGGQRRRRQPSRGHGLRGRVVRVRNRLQEHELDLGRRAHRDRLPRRGGHGPRRAHVDRHATRGRGL